MNEFLANGPTYPIVSYGLTKIHALSPVEWVKQGAIRLAGAKTAEEKRRAANSAIDFFIGAKFLAVAFVWGADIAGPLTISAAFLLLFYNVFTYFWHHLWLPRTPSYAADNPYPGFCVRWS